MYHTDSIYTEKVISLSGYCFQTIHFVELHKIVDM